MQFTLKSLMLFITGASVGIALSKVCVGMQPRNSSILVFTLIMSATAAFWGLAIGAVLQIPWRGLLIGFLAAAAMMSGYFIFEGG